MCGHVGIITKASFGFTNALRDAFASMLFFNSIRGEDATGVAYVNKENEVFWMKDVLPGYDFIKTKDYSSFSSSLFTNGRIAMGHNRKKTIGENKKENAHPFIHNEAVFFHNGTLLQHEELAKTEVDSDALAMVLTECHGDKDKLEAVLKKVKGAFACAWYDTTNKTIYFLRNSQRPFVFAKTKEGDWLYGSEAAILAGAVNRHSISITEFKVCEENVLYSMQMDEVEKGFQEVPLDFFTVTHTKPQKNTTTLVPHGKTGTTDAKLSKNQFKREARGLPSKLTFWCDDVIDITKDGTIHRVVYGSNPEFPNWAFRVELPKEWKLSDAELRHQRLTGEVVFTEYNKITSKGVAHLKNTKIVYKGMTH